MASCGMGQGVSKALWQKLAVLAGVVGEAGSGLLAELGRALRSEGAPAPADPLRSVAFTIAVIALCAKMAKADGIVAAAEVRAFEEVFAVPPQERHNVERVYRLAQQDVAGFEAYASHLARLLKDDRKLLQHVLEGLLHVAAADGVLHPKEDAFLREVAARFGFPESEYRFYRARFVADAASPYDVLGLTPAASPSEIKAKYRQLVVGNHPDKLIGRGVPSEFVAIATRKVAAFNAAYAQIARERRL
jgi:DnaJ like chaperone protein